MRYFESKTPLVKLMAAGGVVIRWTTYDGEVGWYATADKGAIRTLADCIERGVGGLIREGTQAEYEDFLGKTKGRPVFRRERESVGPEGVAMLSPSLPPVSRPTAPASADAVAVDGAPSPQPSVVSPPAPTLRSRGRRGSDAAPA